MQQARREKIEEGALPSMEAESGAIVISPQEMSGFPYSHYGVFPTPRKFEEGLASVIPVFVSSYRLVTTD